MEDSLKKALDQNGIIYQQIVEVDPVESDYLITGVKQGKPLNSTEPAGNKTLSSSHSVPAGKSIIRRLEDLADQDFKRYMEFRPMKDTLGESGESGESGDNRYAITLTHLDSRVEGICECLAVMKNTSRGIEYEEVLNRYQNNITVGEARING